MARSWMHNHSARFVNDDHIRILIGNVKRDRFRCQLRRGRLRNGNGDFISGCEFVVGFDRTSSNRYIPAFNPLLHLRP
ncbi:hypothetical protein D3C76_1492100 [compost metagenome]